VEATEPAAGEAVPRSGKSRVSLRASERAISKVRHGKLMFRSRSRALDRNVLHNVTLHFSYDDDDDNNGIDSYYLN